MGQHLRARCADPSALLAQVGALTADQLEAVGLPAYTVTIAGMLRALDGRLTAKDAIAGVAATSGPR